jgi:membrane-bound serine protease (ClpP class)
MHKKRKVTGFYVFQTVFVTLALLGILLSLQVSAQQTAPVIIAQFSAPVDAGASNFFGRVLALAQSEGARAIVIQMNTPGGYLSDMLNIIHTIQLANNSGIPVYTYVPPNSLAASAGSYIAMATNKILMGDGSEIGPSTPIVVGGTPLEQNHTESAMLKLMVALAAKWNRNTTAAYQMVYADVAYTAQQAYEYHLINGIANSLPEALSELNLTGSPIVTVSENFYEQFLSALSNSVIDGILILLGELAIVLDLYHPTILLTIAGVIAIVAGLVGLEVIQAIDLGFLLLIVAAVLIVLELKLGHGLAMMGGVALGVLGILLLTQGLNIVGPSPINFTSEVVLSGVVAIGVVAGLYVRWIVGPLRAKRKLTGPESLIGKMGQVVSPVSPVGEVRIEGVVWRAKSMSGDIPVGEKVVVKGIEGLTLIVERVQTSEKAVVSQPNNS